MNAARLGGTGDSGGESRKQLERELTECLRLSGVFNVQVRVDRNSGHVVISGTEEELRRLENVGGLGRLTARDHRPILRARPQ
jgi:hypothetical protein